MKKIFTLKNLIKNRGCYTEEKVTELYSSYNRDVTIVDILENKGITLEDKRWVLYNICDLIKKQKIELGCILGKAVTPIFNEEYPEDSSVNDLWQAIDDFNNKVITKEQLLEKRNEAENAFCDIADPAGYAAFAVYYVVSAIYYDTIDVKNVEFCVSNAAHYATIAAIEKKDPIYIKLLNQLMIDFVNKN